MIALGLGGGATALPSGGASVALAVGAASTVYGCLVVLFSMHGMPDKIHH